jgi:hypothetical protein
VLGDTRRGHRLLSCAPAIRDESLRPGDPCAQRVDGWRSPCPCRSAAQTMAAPIAPFFVYSWTPWVVSADFDADGDIDFVVAPTLLGRLDFWRNDGEGRFARDATVYPVPGWSATHSFAAGSVVDIDGVGDLDVAVAMARTSRGNEATRQWLSLDFDNDGDADLLQVNRHLSLFCSPYPSRLLRHDSRTGGGRLAFRQSRRPAHPARIAVAAISRTSAPAPGVALRVLLAAPSGCRPRSRGRARTLRCQPHRATARGPSGHPRCR